jgi:acyl-coenzyme A synthetase/AMP-(fatty) acid ligase/nucleoside-diphosphate-sugar epimerase
MKFNEKQLKKLLNVKIFQYDWKTNLEQDRQKISQLPKGSRILCVLPRSGDWVSCLVACWLEGMVFIPVDPSNDKERINLITDLAKPHLIKNNNGWHETLHNKEDIVEGDVAWICFTSGSTGTPKAVIVSFSGVMTLFNEQIKMFGITENSHVLWTMSPGFDASFSDVGVAIFSDSILYPVSDKTLKNVNELFDFINKNKITYADLTPTLAKVLSKKQTTLECVTFGGEVSDAFSIRELSKQMKVVNVYGPTEATVCTSMIACDSDWNMPSIGKPLSDVEYREFNEELLIAGPCLALGYMNNEEETVKRFINIDGKRWYKTGDRVEWNKETETFLFKGRIDREFKKSGVRISPEEIEWSLKQAEGVKDVKIILQGKSIIAFIEGNDKYAKEKSSLLYHTAKPNKWITLKTWNRLPSGKADMNWLLSHIKQNTDEGVFLDIIEEVTGYKPNWNETFYSCGGDSLSLMNLICLCEEKNININIEAISSNKPFIECFSDNETTGSFIELMHKRTRKIGITGSNGFVGIHLLSEIMNNEKSDITVFGRGNMKEKIIKSCEYYELPIINTDNIVFEEMDLLDSISKQYQLDILYHCAADTTLGDSISNSLNKAEKISKNILKISQNCKLVHISTLSLAVSGPLNLDHRLPAIELGPWTGCYAQAKALSEQILSEHPNVVIIRPALVTGGKKGIIPKHDLFKIAIEECNKTNFIPKGHAELSAIDVETLTKSIYVLSFAKPDIYSIASKKNASIKDIAEQADFERVKNWMSTSGLANLAFSRVLPIEYKKTYDLFLATGWNLTCPKTNLILEKNGIKIPSSIDALKSTINRLTF